MLANCRPLPTNQSSTPEARIGKIAGKIADSITITERKASPNERSHEHNFNRERLIEPFDHRRTVSGRNSRKPGHRDLITGMLCGRDWTDLL